MALPLYLAMTAAEMKNTGMPPSHMAYMACQLSPCGTGLSNCPESLPEGSMLILTDQTPISGHDSARIAARLAEILESNKCCGLLLDFQREGSEEAAALAEFLCTALPCPVAVSHLYGKNLTCPVFLPPVPPDVPLKEYLHPWQGRELWLEAAMDGLEITVTEKGSTSTGLPFPEEIPGSHRDDALHCHYQLQVTDSAARFTLFRTREDVDAFLEEASQLGVAKAVGLWQEWHHDKKEPPGLAGGSACAGIALVY